MSEKTWRLVSCPLEPARATFLLNDQIVLSGVTAASRSLSVTFRVLSLQGDQQSVTIAVSEVNTAKGIYRGQTSDGGAEFAVVFKLTRSDGFDLLSGALTRRPIGAQEVDEDTETITGIACEPPDPLGD